MKLISIVGAVFMGLSASAYAQNIDLLRVDVNEKTGEVAYQINDGEWQQVQDNAATVEAQITKAQYYLDEGAGGIRAPDCNCGAPGRRYYYGPQGYLVPGAAYPPAYGVPVAPPVPAQTYRREEHHITEYKNVQPTAPVPYYPYVPRPYYPY